jgi:hypothetical protein
LYEATGRDEWRSEFPAEHLQLFMCLQVCTGMLGVMYYLLLTVVTRKLSAVVLVCPSLFNSFICLFFDFGEVGNDLTLLQVPAKTGLTQMLRRPMPESVRRREMFYILVFSVDSTVVIMTVFQPGHST